MGQIPPFQYVSTTLDGTTTSVQGGRIPLIHDQVASVTMHAEWNDDTTTNQSLAATALFEVSNDPRAAETHPDNTNADWQDITSSVASATAINPTTGAGDGDLTISNMRYAYFRIKWTRASGDGDVTVYFSAHSD